MRAAFLIAGGTVYLGLVLFDGLESPFFSLVFIVLATYEMVRAHRDMGVRSQKSRKSEWHSRAVGVEERQPN
jgi:hypothetical protein